MSHHDNALLRFRTFDEQVQARRYRADARFARVPHWVLGLTNPVDAVVYGVLTEHLNTDTAEAWPTVTRVAAVANVSTRTVQRSLRSLEDLTLIHGVGDGGRRSARRYRLAHHPADPDYVTVWDTELHHWVLADAVDYALRGYGQPREWDDDVMAVCNQLRFAITEWCRDDPADVVWVVDQLDRAAIDEGCDVVNQPYTRPVPAVDERVSMALVRCLRELLQPPETMTVCRPLEG